MNPMCFYFLNIITLQNFIFQTPFTVNYERFGRFRASRRGEKQQPPHCNKFESSAFAFVCFEISTLLNLEISCLLLFSEGLKFQA